ncbi:MAG: hypothetical protein P4L57_02275 [Rhizomicrobium sp.]|nr:hypothetical protein [Rhizomicrobium sp.]
MLHYYKSIMHYHREHIVLYYYKPFLSYLKRAAISARLKCAFLSSSPALAGIARSVTITRGRYYQPTQTNLMLSKFKQNGILGYVDAAQRVSVGESVRGELQLEFEELYELIGEVRSQTQRLAKCLRFIFFGVDDPDKDEWQARTFP